MKLKRSLRRSTNSDNIMMADRQRTLSKPVVNNSLDGYTRALAAAGSKYGVDDDTVSRKSLRRVRP